MRKRTVAEIADTIFWYSLYFMPIVAFVVCFFRSNAEDGGLNLFYSLYFDFLAVVSTDNVIYDVLSTIFLSGSDILPLFLYNGALGDFAIVYGTWFVSCYLVHLVVDFLLFIPRLCHKYMNKFCQNE